MRFTREADAAAVDLENAFEQKQPEFRPLVGFDSSQCSFLDAERLLLINGPYLCAVDLRDCRDERTFVDMRGRVVSAEVSPKFDLVAVCVDYRRGSTVFMKECADLTKTRNAFLIGILGTQMRLTPNGNLILVLEVDEHRRVGRLSVHTTADGKPVAESRVEMHRGCKLWELSLCPADEDVACLLTDECFHLLRIQPGVITPFSTVKCREFTCHAWSDDVTLAFGTADGRLALYRETLALETIDLGPLHGKLVADAQTANRASVTKMYAASERGLLVCMEIGVVFVFAPLDPDDEDRARRWHTSKAVVIDSFDSWSLCSALSMAPEGDLIAYADQQCIWICNVKYAESTCREGMRLIAAQHSKAIRQIAVDSANSAIVGDSAICATMDSSGLILVTSNRSKKFIASHKEKAALSIAVTRGGTRLLILLSTELQMHFVLSGKLSLENCILKGEDFRLMEPDAGMKQLAVLSAESLCVVDTETFVERCRVPVGHKDEVLALKWSSDGAKVGILSNQDTLCLVDVWEGQLLWNLDLKLRFFVDISVVGDNLYAMGNKFMLSRMSGGREMETTNVHQEGVSLKANSTLLLSTKEVHFVASSMGNVVRMDAQNLESAAVVNCPDRSAVSALHHDPTKDQMFVGFDDGRVVCFNVQSTAAASPEDECEYREDFVLCAVADVLRTESEIKNLTVQCNLIRDQSEGILNDYKEVKERELADLRAELDSTLKTMRDKMKRAEQKYEAIEASKEEAFARMKQEMNDQVEEQKREYEKLLNEQVKSGLERDELHERQQHETEEDFRQKIAQLQDAFRHEERKFQKKERQLNAEKQSLIGDLLARDHHITKLQNKQEKERKQFAVDLTAERQRYEEQSAENIYQIKQLKAYLLREKEAHEQTDASLQETRTELANRNEEMEKLRAELEELNQGMNNENSKSAKLARELDAKKREFEILSQKQKLLTVELDKERQIVSGPQIRKTVQRHAHQRRLKHFEMLIDELSEHVYQPRRLEQHCLSLLAFFNSVPKSGQMQTVEQLNSTEKKISAAAATKRILHLGTSRNKAH